MAIAGTYALTDPSQYVWWFPGSPVKVHVDLRVITELQERLRDTGLGMAESGLLFGRVLEGATEILEFRPASSLSVPEMIAEFAAERGKRLLVGYYRTEYGETLRLNEDDLSLFKTFFGKPYHVFLLIQPNAFAAPNATFFFYRGDQKVSEFPFLEFPLDASLLATEERDRISRCQQATEPAAPVERSLPPHPVNARPRSRFFWKTAVGMLVVVLLSVAVWVGAPAVRERSSRLWTALSSTIGKPQPAAQPPLPATSNLGPHIGLQVKTQNRDLELTWDHESAAVAAATSGLISIEDGSVKRLIPLDMLQLRGESILYSPKSDQVLIQLMVTAPTGVATESVRVIRADSTPTYRVAASSPPHDAVVPRPNPSESDRQVQASRPFTAPPITRHAPSPITLEEPPALAISPDRPASLVASLSGPQILAPPQPTLGPATPAAPVRQGSPAVPIGTEKPAAAAYHPPVPLREVAPTFPFELRSLSLKPTVVAVRVTIDKNGKVQKVEPLPQGNIHRLFIMEAVHAAQLWKFQPARRGDEPVPSESVLRFTFNQ